MTIASLADEQAYLRRQFRGLLIAVTAAVVIGTGVDLINVITNTALLTYVDWLINGTFLLITAVLWWLFQRNQISRASFVASGVMLFLAIVMIAISAEASHWLYIAFLVILAPVFSLPYVPSWGFRWLTLAAGSVGLGIIGYIATVLWQTTSDQTTIANDMLAAGITFSVVLFLLWQFSNLHHILVSSLRGGNTELLELKASLEQQVAERTAELQTTLADLQAQNAVQQRLLGEIQSQQQLIQALSVPVLPLSTQVLVLPLIGSLDTSRLDLIRERALAAIEQSRARVLVLDVTGVPEVDTHIAQGLLHVARATRMMGSQCVLAGMRPELAQALVRLGVDLGSLRTYATLQRALDVVR